jgi:ribosomal protein S4
MLEELYEEFQKFSRAEVQHSSKLGQQRKAANKNESSRHSSTARAKRVHKLLMQHTRKFIASTQMDAGLQRIGRKISDLCGRKAITERMTAEENTSNLEVATPAEAKAGVKLKKDLSIACSTRKILTIRQGIVPFYWNLKRR